MSSQGSDPHDEDIPKNYFMILWSGYDHQISLQSPDPNDKDMLNNCGYLTKKGGFLMITIRSPTISPKVRLSWYGMITYYLTKVWTQLIIIRLPVISPKMGHNDPLCGPKVKLSKSEFSRSRYDHQLRIPPKVGPHDHHWSPNNSQKMRPNMMYEHWQFYKKWNHQ
jgi:hypothetical protein